MPKAKYDLNDNGKIDPDERDTVRGSSPYDETQMRSATHSYA